MYPLSLPNASPNPSATSPATIDRLLLAGIGGFAKVTPSAWFPCRQRIGLSMDGAVRPGNLFQ